MLTIGPRSPMRSDRPHACDRSSGDGLRMSRKRWVVLILILSACGGGSDNLAIVGSSPSTIGVGTQRLVIAEVDPATSEFVGGPDEATTAVFVGPSGDVQQVPADWVWSIEGVRGFLIAHPTFDEAGTWALAIESQRGTTGETKFTVNSDIPIPEVGELAPTSQTRTLADHELPEITTDPEPNPAFYELTVAEAVSNGSPALIVFATPAFCQTAVCGPTMDVVKTVADGFQDLDIVHVEIFENIDSGGAGELLEVPAVIEWGLPSEPWIYVTDPTGRIAARFEGAVSVTELAEALIMTDDQ